MTATTDATEFQRYFTKEGEDPYESIEWTRGTARLGNFAQEDVEHPVSWGPNAVGVAAKIYFATVNGVRENSIRQMIYRVATKITVEGLKDGYFGRPASDIDLDFAFEDKTAWSRSATSFHAELSYLLLHQMGAFNTPVWLNLGVPGRKQCASACYLNSVEDTMLGERFGGKGDHSIMDLVATEAAIFKMGAGSGVNISPLRGDTEPLTTGGTASGPTSYMRLLDANAGTLKSGGAHRRAAKMVIENDDHPMIFDFVDCKAREDDRMRALLAAGFEIDPFTPSGEKLIAEVTSFQNANLSVGASSSFMCRALGEPGYPPEWALTARTTGETVETVIAKDLLDAIVDRAWRCGDPGMVFLDTANAWHTTPMLRGLPSPITTCNPCAETYLNDDSACNLASLNILTFMHDDGELNIRDFQRAVDVFVTAMDITCSFSANPTPSIDRNTKELRQLGLGYANLGAALMCKGMPYDSKEGRDWAASLTALLTGRAYKASGELASKLGAYKHFAENRDTHLAVVDKHIGAFPKRYLHNPMWSAAMEDWNVATKFGSDCGYRNSQLSVIAPTGTISWLMGCDTSGLEPGFALTFDKGLAGGGTMRVVSGAVTRALHNLNYGVGTVDHMVQALTNEGVDAFMALLDSEHRSVFHCANDIAPNGHIDMVLRIQPFVSGAPSKTVNLDNSATREDIYNCIVRAWRGGAKCISIFRDGSKVTSILSHTKVDDDDVEVEIVEEPGLTRELVRKRLPTTRPSLTHKFVIHDRDDHEGYISAGYYPDTGEVGEIFLTGVGKEGTFLQGMMNLGAIAVSVGLQYGVPLQVYVDKFAGMDFEPRGRTENPNIPEASSLPDYIFRWLAEQFLDADYQEAAGVLTPEVKALMAARWDEAEKAGELGVVLNGHNLPARGTRPCGCGGRMVLRGTCWTCLSDPTHNSGCG